uniref:Uncharacterized protein n=1 Tax=Peronospora matthiolae TaxID=2874970 RepID=A0AAV1VBC7_9STRA
MRTPRQVRSHANELFEYQVWTGYRVALGQLNVYHAGRSTTKVVEVNNLPRLP